MVTGLGGNVFFAAADDFAVGSYVVETVLASGEEGLEAAGLAIGFHGADAVFAAGFSGVALAGLYYFTIVGAQAVPELAAFRKYFKGCHEEKEVKREGNGSKLGGLRQWRSYGQWGGSLGQAVGLLGMMPKQGAILFAALLNEAGRSRKLDAPNVVRGLLLHADD